MRGRALTICLQLALFLLVMGCRRVPPESTPLERIAGTIDSHVSEPKAVVRPSPSDATQEGRATRPLKPRKPIDHVQSARHVDLTITWRGDPPGDARVFVGKYYVGRGRPAFEKAVEAVGALPKRGKLRMSHVAFSTDGGEEGPAFQQADPFSAWPDLDAAFQKAVSEKEICITEDYEFDFGSDHEPSDPVL